MIELDERTHPVRVQDGTRFLEFDGSLIGSATSDDGRAQRWTEVNIYVTDTGKFVASKIGRSVVYHTDNKRCGRHGERSAAGKLDIINEMIPCKHCNPPSDILLEPDTIIRLEKTRYSAHVAESAQGLVEALHRRDGNDLVYLPRVCRRALEEAARRNDDIRSAWSVQRI